MNCLTSLVFIESLPSSKMEKPEKSQRQQHVFTTHLANKAAESVYRGKHENIIEYHKAQPRGSGYLKLPQNGELSGRSQKQDTNQTLRPRRLSRGGSSRGGSSTRSARVRKPPPQGLRRSRRLAKVPEEEKEKESESEEEESEEEDDEEEDEEMEEKVSSLDRSVVRKRPTATLSSPAADSASSSDESSQDESEEDEQTQEDLPPPSKQPKLAEEQTKSSKPAKPPPSSQPSPPSHENRQEPVLNKKNIPRPQETSNPTTPHDDQVPLSAGPNNTPDTLRSSDVNYTICHGTPEGMAKTPEGVAKAKDSKLAHTTSSVSTTVATRSSEKPSQQQTVQQQQRWPPNLPSQFNPPGSYPQLYKHPMAAYGHAPQHMAPGNYPYHLPYPWPHPQHPGIGHHEHGSPAVSSPVPVPWSGTSTTSAPPLNDPKMSMQRFVQKGSGHERMPGAQHGLQSSRQSVQFPHLTDSGYPPGFDPHHPAIATQMWQQSAQMQHPALMNHAHLAAQWGYPQPPHYPNHMGMQPLPGKTPEMKSRDHDMKKANSNHNNNTASTDTIYTNRQDLSERHLSNHLPSNTLSRRLHMGDVGGVSSSTIPMSVILEQNRLHDELNSMQFQN